ncbi:uncharacterized protein LOC134206585 [Armigeres subalbatus]|uniref:uncharacterized protein LOC134206585 n=1 Tax=Armigeres subalbatus TaxID=124917 RepID=UPI002ED4D982
MSPIGLTIMLTCLGIPLSCFLIPNPTQRLEITDLSNHPGLFALKMGKVFIREGYHTLIHEFKLSAFQIVLNQYELIINELEQNPQTVEITQLLRQKLRQASVVFQNLIPRQKHKRSIEILGSIVKSITGNLDSQDFKTLSNQIDTLKNSNNVLITENNEQIKINELFEKRLNNLTKQAYIQASEINRFIKQARLNLDRAIDWQHMLHLQNIIFNMYNVRYQLDIIFESIQLSKLGVISKAFLYPTELEFAIHLLTADGIEVNSYDQAYEYLEPSAFHNGSSIILLVKIPKFKIGNYQLIRLETIPIDGKVIQINGTYAITSETESFLTNEKCTHVEDNLLCNSQYLVNVTENECYHKILRGNPGRCPFISTSLKSPEIKPLENNGILLKNIIKPLTLQNSCGYGPKNLTGSFYITFFNSKLDVIPLHFVEVNRSSTQMDPLRRCNNYK